MLRNRRTTADRSEINDGMRYYQYRHVSRTSWKSGLFVWVILHRNYVPLVDLLGIWFQIRDDYMNLQSSTVGNLHV